MLFIAFITKERRCPFFQCLFAIATDPAFPWPINFIGKMAVLKLRTDRNFNKNYVISNSSHGPTPLSSPSLQTPFNQFLDNQIRMKFPLCHQFVEEAGVERFVVDHHPVKTLCVIGNHIGGEGVAEEDHV